MTRILVVLERGMQGQVDALPVQWSAIGKAVCHYVFADDREGPEFLQDQSQSTSY